jgi:hypothetical protein
LRRRRFGGFSGFGGGQPSVQEPAEAPEIPATIRADEIVGRWGLASFHSRKIARAPKLPRAGNARSLRDRAGRHGGVIMHLPDEATRRNCA